MGARKQTLTAEVFRKVIDHTTEQTLRLQCGHMVDGDGGIPPEVARCKVCEVHFVNAVWQKRTVRAERCAEQRTTQAAALQCF